MMRGSLLIIFLILIEINQSTAERNFSICYATYCYFWNGEISQYDKLKPCPEAHWTLEIYDEGVQSEVLEFISSIHNNNSKLPLMGYYVPLNLICTNSTTCIWKHANRTAAYLNWEYKGKWSDTNVVYYFRANTSLETTKWNRAGSDYKHPYPRFCMKTNPIRTTTFPTSQQEVNESKKYPNATAGDDLYITTTLAVVGMVLVVLIGVVVFVAFRKRLRTGAMSSSSSSTKSRANTESANHEIAHQFSSESGKTIYAEVPKEAEDNSNQRQSSIQYADLNWSTNISKVEENESKPVEDQRRNYFGPMGDVYARIQKG